MKLLTQILFGCFLLFPILAVASDELPIEPYPSELLTDVAEGQGIAEATVPQLRAIAERGGFLRQEEAVKELISRADDATVARLVYALRRGNALAESILLDTASLPMVNYLLEDVAHGSMERYYSSGEPAIGQVRVAATAIVTEALARTPGLPADTVEWFESLRRTGSRHTVFVPEQSKAVIDWWTHNISAMQTGSPEKATWLPDDKQLIPSAYTAWEKSRSAIPPPPPPPPPPVPPPHSSLPFSIAEPFGQWVERVGKLGIHDLKVSDVDFEGRPKAGTGLRVSKDRQKLSPVSDRSEERSRLKEDHAPASMSVTSLISWRIAAIMVAAIWILWLAYKKRVFRGGGTNGGSR